MPEPREPQTDVVDPGSGRVPDASDAGGGRDRPHSGHDAAPLVYGPVPSRRLGRSLGVDLVPFKTCTHDCVYCQLGPTTDRTTTRRPWVEPAHVLREIRSRLDTRPDVITLAGSGEPTLCTGLDLVIDGIKAMTTVPVFAEHNYMVYTQRCASTNSFPLGALVSGNKKDVVISSKIYAKLQPGVPKPVVIYGWHKLDGSPIQPLYNGHEESYADYSHGIRLVQNVMLVDGIPTTVSSVLTNPSLAALLSDEGPAEGTTSTGVIQVPRYSPAPRAPVIMAPPRAQTVLPGASPVFRLLAAGDAPLRYSWRFYGAPLPGATQATLALSNVQAAQAGFYAVVVSNLSGVVTSRPARLRVNTNVHPALFADSLDGNTSAHWDLYWGAGNGVADYTANWAADYGGTAYTFNGFTNILPVSYTHLPLPTIYSV